MFNGTTRGSRVSLNNILSVAGKISNIDFWPRDGYYAFVQTGEI